MSQNMSRILATAQIKFQIKELLHKIPVVLNFQNMANENVSTLL